MANAITGVSKTIMLHAIEPVPSSINVTDGNISAFSKGSNYGEVCLMRCSQIHKRRQKCGRHRIEKLPITACRYQLQRWKTRCKNEVIEIGMYWEPKFIN
jgi:hypothetical protein